MGAENHVLKLEKKTIKGQLAEENHRLRQALAESQAQSTALALKVAMLETINQQLNIMVATPNNEIGLTIFNSKS